MNAKYCSDKTANIRPSWTPFTTPVPLLPKTYKFSKKMNRFYCSVSACALTVSLTLVSLRLCGQSTKPFAADSLSAVAEYVRNSRALLDSLTRLSDTRLQLTISKGSVSALQSRILALETENFKLRNDANEMAARLFDCNQLYDELHKKKSNANWERWIWRGVSVVGSAFWLRGKIRDP